MAPRTHLATQNLRTQIDLMDVASALADRKQITRGQWVALVKLLLPVLPITVAFVQRTPKGTLYVYIHDGAKYSIDCRAKLQRIV
jgi:hypothetical protein